MPMLEFFVLASEAAPEIAAATETAAAFAPEALAIGEGLGGFGAFNLGAGATTAGEQLMAEALRNSAMSTVAGGEGASVIGEGMYDQLVNAFNNPTLSNATAYAPTASTSTVASDAYLNNPLVNQASTEGIANLKVPPAGVNPTGYGFNPASTGIDGYTASATPSFYTPDIGSTAPNLLSPSSGAGQQALMNAQYPTSPLQSGFDKALSYMEKHPFQTGIAGYTIANKLGMFDPKRQGYSSPQYSSKLYPLSANFQPSVATPNVYRPRYAAEGGIMMAAGGSYEDEPMGDVEQMASGGIASYSRGEKVKNYMEVDPTFLQMIEGKSVDYLPESVSIPRTGINYDLDPDTRYKDSLTASMIREGKINAKAGVKPYANLKRPTPLGTLNLAPPGVKAAAAAADEGVETAAHGGIMQAADHYSMGGYASGSVPRLLKGPGDGMSDDIPATIDEIGRAHV